jgi:hypothetical protein
MPSILLNVPLLPQRDRADCLPACVQMVLTYQGRSVDPSWLRRVLESTKIGTPGFKVLNLERHGYSVTYSPATDAAQVRPARADAAYCCQGAYNRLRQNSKQTPNAALVGVHEFCAPSQCAPVAEPVEATGSTLLPAAA